MNLPIRLAELTRAPVNFDGEHEPNHVVIQATEPELFKCPFVMITEVGATFFDDRGSPRPAAYLQKGGFMWADDFWGEVRVAALGARAAESSAGERVPDHRRADESLDLPHALRREAVPADSVYWMGATAERPSERGPDSATPHARAVVDQKGRIIVFISHNTDFGDSVRARIRRSDVLLQFLRGRLRDWDQHPAICDDALSAATFFVSSSINAITISTNHSH